MKDVTVFDLFKAIEAFPGDPTQKLLILHSAGQMALAALEGGTDQEKFIRALAAQGSPTSPNRQSRQRKPLPRASRP